MKHQHIVKSVAFTTALGVFLTGCGGGPDTTHGTTSATRTTTPSTSTTNPIVNPVTSGGSGTIGGNDTATVDTVSADIKAMNAKLDQTLAAANSANSNAKKASNKSTWILALAGFAGAALLAKMINTGIKNKKAGASTGRSITSGLLQDDSRVTGAQINAGTAAVNMKTEEVGATGMNTTLSLKPAIDGAAANAAAANISANGALAGTVALANHTKTVDANFAALQEQQKGASESLGKQAEDNKKELNKTIGEAIVTDGDKTRKVLEPLPGQIKEVKQTADSAKASAEATASLLTRTINTLNAELLGKATKEEIQNFETQKVSPLSRDLAALKNQKLVSDEKIIALEQSMTDLNKNIAEAKRLAEGAKPIAGGSGAPRSPAAPGTPTVPPTGTPATLLPPVPASGGAHP